MNKVILGAVALGLVVAGCATTETAATETVQDREKSVATLFDEQDKRERAEFADQLKQVAAFKSKDEVHALLGEPDAVQIIGPEGPWVEGDELWLFGTPDSSELPVLGTVCFRDEQVIWRIGTNEPDPDLPPEKELRELLRFMHRTAPDNWGTAGDPLHGVRVANRLIPLGKEEAIATINEFSSLGFSDDDWLYWLVQSLFDVPKDPGYMRPPRIGGYGQQLQQETRVPRFPTVLIDDVPVTIFAGAVLAGEAEPVSRYLQEIGKEDMRTDLLRPTDDPFGSLESLWNSQRWPFPYEPGENDYRLWTTESKYKRIVLQQVLNLVRTVYHPSDDLPYYPDDEDIAMDYFEKYRKEFEAIGAVWNEQKQMYTLKDGSAPYPKIEPVTDRRKIRSTN